jgi:DNA-binding response OmpR family regulator
LQDPAKKEAIRLTDKENRILKYLLRSGSIVDRLTLLSEVWGYNAGVTTHTIETHIYRLRQKIEVNPATPRLLVTNNGQYGIVNNVSEDSEL